VSRLNRQLLLNATFADALFASIEGSVCTRKNFVISVNGSCVPYAYMDYNHVCIKSRS